MKSGEDQNKEGGLLDVQARVVGPQGKEETLTLKQTGPRRYQAEFPLWGKGRYQAMVAASGQGRTERAVGGLALPYSPEYLRFRSDPIVLEHVAQATGGRVLAGNETGKELFGIDRTARATSRSIVDIFLLVLACLVPLDVAVRRLQPDWALIKRWFGLGRKMGTTVTLGALLKRKQQIEFIPGGKAGEKEGPKFAPPLPRRPVSKPAVPRPVGKPEPERPVDETTTPGEKPEVPKDDKDQSTTERLLARKKKWRKE